MVQIVSPGRLIMPSNEFQKRRILFYRTSLAGGGAERVLIGLLENIDRRKYSITLVLDRKIGAYIDKVPEDINLVELNSRKSGYLGFRLLRLLAVIKRERPDVMVSFSAATNEVLVSAKALSGFKGLIVLRYGNNPVLNIDRKGRVPWGPLIKRLKVRMLYGRASKIITVSEGISRQLVEVFQINPSKVIMVPNPVNRGFIEKMCSNETGFPIERNSATKILVAVGRLIPQKGYSDMIQAFRLIRDIVPSKLFILGEGPLREAMQREASELNLDGEIKLLGFVENPWIIIKGADLFISTSHWEGMPNALLEAMACGVAPVVTDCDYGPSEIITHGVDGNLVPVGAIEQFASETAALLRNDKERRRIAENAKRRSMDFDMDIVVKKYEKVFDG